jgi:hypothetical protein
MQKHEQELTPISIDETSYDFDNYYDYRGYLIWHNGYAEDDYSSFSAYVYKPGTSTNDVRPATNAIARFNSHYDRDDCLDEAMSWVDAQLQ